MGKYISLEEAEKFISENKHRFGITVANSCSFREMLRMMKTADVSEVVHARWENNKDEYPECTNCGYMPMFDPSIDDIYYSPFCPNCGAKMDLTGADT